MVVREVSMTYPKDGFVLQHDDTRPPRIDALSCRFLFRRESPLTDNQAADYHGRNQGKPNQADSTEHLVCGEDEQCHETKQRTP